MERRLVRRATTDDYRDFELTDEALQVERFDRLGNVLGRDDRALDHEQVELGIDQRLGVLGRALGGQRSAGHDAGRLDLPDAGGDQLRLDGLRINLLHPRRGLVGASWEISSR